MTTRTLLSVCTLLLGSSALGAQAPAVPEPEPPAQTSQLPHQVETIPAEPALDANKVTAGRKKGKEVYTGPTAVVELPPTPMLDEEGQQRLDPDGKPMFNPPVRQQRDKKGHPLFDEQGKPVMQTASELGYDEHGRKLKPEREKTPKQVSVEIEHGTLTVDGMTGKAALNYDIKDLHYIYFYVPWIGTTVVSLDPFPGAIEQKDAFDGNTLTVHVADHALQLYSDKRLLGKKPQAAYVAVDPNFRLATHTPAMGYGTLHRAPYTWPGARADEAIKGYAAPPLPENLKPALALTPCPAGQMRRTPPAGQAASAAQPCVPFSQAAAPVPPAKP